MSKRAPILGRRYDGRAKNALKDRQALLSFRVHDERVKISGLPPGDYQVVVLDAVEPGEANDPEFLGRIKSDAILFSLNEGETKVLDLRIASSP